MIEAIMEGGLKSLAIAGVLLIMSFLSLASLVAEALRIRREISLVPIRPGEGVGTWAKIDHLHNQFTTAGLSGKLLQKKLHEGARQIAAQGAGHENILASVGANAPYVGLFGTVVGIYGALHALGLGTSVTADRIAASVGEALVMTALGLVVAIPAVFGFNYILGLRKTLATMAEAYATWIITGVNDGPHIRTLKKSTKKKGFPA